VSVTTVIMVVMTYRFYAGFVCQTASMADWSWLPSWHWSWCRVFSQCSRRFVMELHWYLDFFL